MSENRTVREVLSDALYINRIDHIVFSGNVQSMVIRQK